MPTPAAGSIHKAASSTTCAAWAWSRLRRTSAKSSLASLNGIPVRIKDIGRVEIGHAPRLGIFGFQTKQKKDDDAVEGVILMRRGEQTQNVLEGVEKKTEEINKTLLPPDVKVRPYYDRSDLVRVTTDTVEGNLLRGMVLVFMVLIFFLAASARRSSPL